MKLSDLPPTPHSVILKNGKPYWAQNLEESFLFWNHRDEDRDPDSLIAASVVGSVTISTVLLPIVLGHGMFMATVTPGAESTCGQAFETMIQGNDVSTDKNSNLEQFRKHDTLEQAVLFHMQAREHYSRAERVSATWVAKPYRLANHGTPSDEIKKLLEG